MSDKVTITALVPTFNEAHNISDCLECLTWVDQIIVVDSFSKDATIEIARSFTDHVYQHEYVNSATQKNWAMSHLPIGGDWTLIVDADERIVPELAAEIRVSLLPPNDHAGFFINRRNYFCGRWIRTCGWYPSYNLRLFRTGRGRYEDREVDADVAVDGSVGYLRNDMLHFSYPTISDFLRKLDRYTTWEALDRQSAFRAHQSVEQQKSQTLSWRMRRALFRALPMWLRPPLTLLHMLLWERGFMDGSHGLILSCLYAWREFLTCAKVWETRCQRRSAVQTTDPS